MSLHAAAGVMVAVALAWRTVPMPAGVEPSFEVLWLPPADSATDVSTPPDAGAPGTAMDIGVLGPAAIDGAEPEDALATMVGGLHLPMAPPPAEGPLPPLPIPHIEAPAPPENPAGLFAAPVVPPPPAIPPASPDSTTPLAALAVPPQPETPFPAAPTEDLPLPPPAPLPPRRSAPARAPAAQPAASPMPPSPPGPEPAAIPVLAGAPRFRRPPAPPDYPTRAREAGIEGTALLRLRIGADGTTREVLLLRSAGHRLLDEAAQAAARGWEIAPALQAGRPIEAWVEVPVRFRLDD